MKTVAADSLLIQLARRRVGVVDPGMNAMKRGIEAGNLKRIRKGGVGSPDAR